jgi:hypothetical protein
MSNKESANAIAIASLLKIGALVFRENNRYNRSESPVDEYWIKGTGCYLWHKTDLDHVAIVEPDFDMYCIVKRDVLFERLPPESRKAFSFHMDLLERANKDNP